jgi:AraC-like DNA-binding protein
MNGKLHKIQNWPKLARQANYSVADLATKFGVSVRTLHRYFLKQMGKNTKAWLAEERQRHAHKLLHDGFSIKETAFWLGYKQSTNFTRKHKRPLGHLSLPDIAHRQPRPD